MRARGGWPVKISFFTSPSSKLLRFFFPRAPFTDNCISRNFKNEVGNTPMLVACCFLTVTQLYLLSFSQRKQVPKLWRMKDFLSVLSAGLQKWPAGPENWLASPQALRPGWVTPKPERRNGQINQWTNGRTFYRTSSPKTKVKIKETVFVFIEAQLCFVSWALGYFCIMNRNSFFVFQLFPT